LLRPPGTSTISKGIIIMEPASPESILDYSEYQHGKYLLKNIVDKPVVTLNGIRLGKIMDFVIGGSIEILLDPRSKSRSRRRDIKQGR